MEDPKLLLDSNILIDYFRANKKENTLLHMLYDSYPQLSISIITEFEVLSGSSPDRWFYYTNFLNDFHIYPLSKDVVHLSSKIYYGLNKRGELIGSRDIFVASTAINYGLELATLNKKHFSRIENLNLIDLTIFR